MDRTNSHIASYLNPVFQAARTQESCVLLEVGIGIGDMYRHLSSIPGYSYLGFDGSLEVCRNASHNQKAVVYSRLPQFPLKPSSLNVIYFSHVIEHLFDYRTVVQTLSRMGMALKPNGRLIVLFPEYGSWKDDFYEIDYTHNFPMGIRRMRQLATDVGFEVERWTDYCGPYLGISGRAFGLFGKLLPLRTLAALAPKGLGRLRRSSFIFNRNLLFVLRR